MEKWVFSENIHSIAHNWELFSATSVTLNGLRWKYIFSGTEEKQTSKLRKHWILWMKPSGGFHRWIANVKAVQTNKSFAPTGLIEPNGLSMINKNQKKLLFQTSTQKDHLIQGTFCHVKHWVVEGIGTMHHDWLDPHLREKRLNWHFANFGNIKSTMFSFIK